MKQRDEIRAWFYLAVVWFVNFSVFGIINSFGIFHVIYMERFEESNSKAGWIGSVLVFSAALACPLSIFLRRHFGFRRTIFGAFVLIVFAFLSTPYMHVLDLLFITYAIPFGVAGGLIECLTTVTLPQYFDKYLGMATGIRFSANAAGPIAVGYFFPLAFESFGWKKTMNFLSLVGTTILLCIVVYQPPDTEEKSSELIKLNKKTKAQLPQKKFTFKFLRNKIFQAILLGNVVFVAVIYTPTMFMMQYAKTLGYPLSRSKWLLITYSICSIVGRVFIGRVADIAMKYHKLSYILPSIVLFTAIATALCSCTQYLPYIILYMGVVGGLEGMFWVIQPLVVAEIIPREEIDDAYSSVYFTMAFGLLGGPPLLGWIFDVTGNFRIVLYVVTAVSLLAGAIMIIGMLVHLPSKDDKNDYVTTNDISYSIVLLERETNV